MYGMPGINWMTLGAMGLESLPSVERWMAYDTIGERGEAVLERLIREKERTTDEDRRCELTDMIRIVAVGVVTCRRKAGPIHPLTPMAQGSMHDLDDRGARGVSRVMDTE